MFLNGISYKLNDNNCDRWGPCAFGVVGVHTDYTDVKNAPVHNWTTSSLQNYKQRNVYKA